MGKLLNERVQSSRWWFEASEQIVTRTEEEGCVTNCLGLGSSVASQANMDVESANCLTTGLVKRPDLTWPQESPTKARPVPVRCPRLTAPVRPLAGWGSATRRSTRPLTSRGLANGCPIHRLLLRQGDTRTGRHPRVLTRWTMGRIQLLPPSCSY